VYFCGLLLPQEGRTGFYRLVLQRIGAGLFLEAMLMYLLRRLILPGGTAASIALVAVGSVMLIGVPSLVKWQLGRVRVVGTKVRPAQRPHWALVLITAALVMSLLGSGGYLIGGLTFPSHCEGFCFSPVGQAVGLVAGFLLGLALVRRGVRQSS